MIASAFIERSDGRPGLQWLARQAKIHSNICMGQKSIAFETLFLGPIHIEYKIVGVDEVGRRKEEGGRRKEGAARVKS